MSACKYMQQVRAKLNLVAAAMSSPPPSDSKTHAHDDGLARAWEGDFNVRERMRFGAGKLLVWPKGKANAELIGQTSMQALSMNCNVLTIMAAWWCPTQTTPKTPSITVVKAQVGLRKRLPIESPIAEQNF